MTSVIVRRCRNGLKIIIIIITLYIAFLDCLLTFKPSYSYWLLIGLQAYKKLRGISLRIFKAYKKVSSANIIFVIFVKSTFTLG